MPCCVNLINVFFRHHNFLNKKFPEQVKNFQFSREPPPNGESRLCDLNFELVQVHSVKYFTDCICGFVYFLNGKFTLGKILHTTPNLLIILNVSKLLKLVPQHIWV